AGEHQLVLGLTQAQSDWPLQIRTAQAPLLLEGLPENKFSDHFGRITIQLPDPDRRLALWVLSQNGKVKLHSPDGKEPTHELNNREALPSIDFTVQNIDLLGCKLPAGDLATNLDWVRSEEHTSELQSRGHLVCRLL